MELLMKWNQTYPNRGLVETFFKLIPATSGSLQEASRRAPSANGEQVALQGHGTRGS
jgi:hypothetical protein